MIYFDDAMKGIFIKSTIECLLEIAHLEVCRIIMYAVGEMPFRLSHSIWV